MLSPTKSGRGQDLAPVVGCPKVERSELEGGGEGGSVRTGGGGAHGFVNARAVRSRPVDQDEPVERLPPLQSWSWRWWGRADVSTSGAAGSVTNCDEKTGFLEDTFNAGRETGYDVDAIGSIGTGITTTTREPSRCWNQFRGSSVECNIDLAVQLTDPQPQFLIQVIEFHGDG